MRYNDQMKPHLSVYILSGLLFLALGLAGCLGQVYETTPLIQGEIPANTPQRVLQPTSPPPTQPSPTILPSTSTPTTTLPPRPTIPTATATSAHTPTPAQPVWVVQQQAHCRYGPGTAYLHAHDLYPGDRGVIDGRNENTSWLWIQPDGLERHCWAAASILTWQGDVGKLPVVTSKLPYSNLYGPPQNVQTARDGSQVTIAWNPLPFTQDDFRGYMLELTTCQGGALATTTIQTNDTSITVTDDTNCGGASGGRLWGVEKHGYTQSVEIPWP